MDITTQEPIYTVSELNQQIRDFLEGHVAPLWISGEISNFACPSSGHWYFTLKDAKASVRCALFQPRGRGIEFKPANGDQVLIHGRVSLYEARGEYQLIADYIEPAGDGLLQKAFNELKTKLAAEGLFDQENKVPIPAFPKSIGVITSSTGAAIRDILTVLARRYPLINVIIYPTSVQGKIAAGEIVNALQLANARKDCEVLIVGRGGGSLEDLWPFNEESVARAIYASKLPIISAVGHEIDFTIADFVADLRAATPSAAAELVSPDQNELQLHCQKLQQRLSVLLEQSTKLKTQQLLHLSQRLRHPAQKIQEQTQQLDQLDQRLNRTMQYFLQHKQLELAKISRALHTTSPLATLDRGYAFIKNEQSQNIISTIKNVNIHDNIIARVRDGNIHCVVNKTEPL